MSLPPLYKKVLSIAAPSVAELILASLTSVADTIMVGRLGAYAISAVGLTNQPRFIMLATFVALNVGATALVARFKGQENRADAEIVTGQAIVLSLLLSIGISMIGVAFARPMVLFMGAAPDTVEAGAAYFRILMMGFVPTVLPIAISALLRGVGDAKTAMRYNVTANVVNIVFNYLLIYGKFGFPRLEVEGAAIATVIGNCAACVMAFRAVLGKGFGRKDGQAASYIRLRLSAATMLPHWSMIRRIVKIGLPSAAEQFALRAGLLIYTMTITALGTTVFAAHQIVLSILNMSFVNGQAFGIAATSLTGQALGRGDKEGARDASSACQRSGAIISTCLGVLMFAFRRPLVSLYTDEAAIIAMATGVMLLVGVLQPFQSSFQIYAGALRGAGDSLYPAISLAVGILGIRPLASYLLIHVAGWGLFGAWVALLIDQCARFFLIRARYRAGKWTHIQV